MFFFFFLKRFIRSYQHPRPTRTQQPNVNATLQKQAFLDKSSSAAQLGSLIQFALLFFHMTSRRVGPPGLRFQTVKDQTERFMEKGEIRKYIPFFFFLALS